METAALVKALEDAGLSPYQADAYVVLLDLGVASATDVARVPKETPGRAQFE